jgi:hypothetical protein
VLLAQVATVHLIPIQVLLLLMQAVVVVVQQVEHQQQVELAVVVQLHLTLTAQQAQPILAVVVVREIIKVA